MKTATNGDGNARNGLLQLFPVVLLSLVVFGLFIFVDPNQAHASPLEFRNQLNLMDDRQEREDSVKPLSMIDSVLDTYSYFYCYSDTSHNNPLMYPTYRNITFRNSYSRIYPDECLSDQTLSQFPCPSNINERGLLKTYRCHYKTY